MASSRLSVFPSVISVRRFPYVGPARAGPRVFASAGPGGGRQPVLAINSGHEILSKTDALRQSRWELQRLGRKRYHGGHGTTTEVTENHDARNRALRYV